MDINSKFQQVSSLSWAQLGRMATFYLPAFAVTHRIWFHCAPATDPGGVAYEIGGEVQFYLKGAVYCALPFKVTNSPLAIYSNLFPVDTTGQYATENTISIAYPSDANSYVLFPRSLVSAYQAQLFLSMSRRIDTGAQIAVKFFWAVDSASLPS